ncbi:MAG TPA: hypothetical protein VFI02_03920 [Armatimonadota bacterium]|nr:hypothetical protein [Armatimonadota bacterium]
METASQQFNPETSKVDEGNFVEKFGEPSFELGLAAKRPFEQMARLALLYAGGQQTIELNDSDMNQLVRRAVQQPQCETVSRVNNRIPIYLRSISAAFGTNLPDFEGVPHTQDLPDTEAAGVGTRILKWCDRKDKEAEKRKIELNWTLCTGEALRFDWWDTKGGRPGRKEGDTQSDWVSLFNYCLDPYSVNIWPPRWLIYYDCRHVDEIQSMYGKKVEPEDVTDVMRWLDRLALNVPGSRESSRETLKDHAILKCLYAPPSQRYPEGYCWDWTKKELLNGRKLQAGQWPWSRFQWFTLAARLYGMGLVEWLMSDQKQVNLLLSQMQEVATRQLRGDIVTMGSNQKITEIVIDAKSGRKQIMLPPGISKYDILQYSQIWSNAAQLYEWLITDMDWKAGTSQSFLGHEVKRDATLGEIQLAVERDLGMLNWHMETYAEYLTDVGRHKLALTAKYVKNIRMMELFGRAEANAIPYFTGASLLDTRDVIAIPVPRLSPAMKRQAIVQAGEMGWLPPWEGPEHQLRGRMLLRYMGLTEMEDELGQTYGSLDDLRGYVGQLSAMSRELLMMQARAALELAANPPAPAPEEMQMAAG